MQAEPGEIVTADDGEAAASNEPDALESNCMIVLIEVRMPAGGPIHSVRTYVSTEAMHGLGRGPAFRLGASELLQRMTDHLEGWHD